jgi:hypothetical protein
MNHEVDEIEVMYLGGEHPKYRIPKDVVSESGYHDEGIINNVYKEQNFNWIKNINGIGLIVCGFILGWLAHGN